MRIEALKKRWRERMENFKALEKLEIKEREEECKRKREALANALEKTAAEVRQESDTTEKINNHFLCIADELEDSDAGTLNLPPCPPSKSRISEDVSMYRDMAEYYKSENRRLKVRASESIEAVRQFWRNNIFEERTRAGKMVMFAMRQTPQRLTD